MHVIGFNDNQKGYHNSNLARCCTLSVIGSDDVAAPPVIRFAVFSRSVQPKIRLSLFSCPQQPLSEPVQPVQVDCLALSTAHSEN
jgi:hypothetical protein